MDDRSGLTSPLRVRTPATRLVAAVVDVAVVGVALVTVAVAVGAAADVEGSVTVEVVVAEAVGAVAPTAEASETSKVRRRPLTRLPCLCSIALPLSKSFSFVLLLHVCSTAYIVLLVLVSSTRIDA